MRERGAYELHMGASMQKRGACDGNRGACMRKRGTLLVSEALRGAS